jgi:hypothetical protein
MLGFVERARFRTVANGLGTIPFVLRIPMVYYHLHRHPAPPDTATAFARVGAGAEPAVAAVPVDFQSRGFVHIPTEKVNSAIVDRFLATYLWRACKLPRPEN